MTALDGMLFPAAWVAGSDIPEIGEPENGRCATERTPVVVANAPRCDIHDVVLAYGGCWRCGEARTGGRDFDTCEGWD